MDTLSSSVPDAYALTTDFIPLSQLFARTDDAVCAIDAQQRILYWNQAAEATLGYAAEEVIGRPCYQVLQGKKPANAAFCCQNCLLLQEVEASAACTCHLLFLKPKHGGRRLFCVSTLAVVENQRQNGGPFLIHLWRSSTLPCRLPPFDIPGSSNEKCLRLIQTLRLQLEALLALEASDASDSTPV